MLVLVNLLKKPNPNNPLEGKIAAELRDNPQSFYKNARKWTQDFAKL